MADLLKIIGETFRVLSERLGFTISKMDSDLYTASMQSNFEVLTAKLHESPFTILQRTPDGDTLLHICAGEGDASAVRMIANCYELSAPWIRMWPLIQVKNSRGNTALHEAAAQGNSEVVQLLLQLNRKLANQRNSNGETALFLACENGKAAAVEAILSFKSSSARMLAMASKDGQNCLHIAAYKGRLEVLRLIAQKEEVALKYLEKCDDSGATPLHCAAAGGYSEAAQFLTRCRPDVCYKYDKLGRCPIHVAAISGNADTIEAITNVVPDCVRMLSKRHKSILHYAVENDHINLVQWLSQQTQYKLRGDERDKKGNQPLHLAARNGIDETMVKTLIERYPRVQVNGRNKEGFRAVDLIYSGQNRSKECAVKAKRYLQCAGALVDHDKGREEEEDTNVSERESRSQRNSRMMDISALIGALIATVAASGTLQIPSPKSICVEGKPDSQSDCQYYALVVGIYVIANSIAFFSAVTVLLVWVVMEVSWRHTERPWLKSSMSVLALSLVAMSIAFTLASEIGTWTLDWSPGVVEYALVLPVSVVPLVTLAWIITAMCVWCGRAKHQRSAQIKRLFKRALLRLLPGFVMMLSLGIYVLPAMFLS